MLEWHEKRVALSCGHIFWFAFINLLLVLAFELFLKTKNSNDFFSSACANKFWKEGRCRVCEQRPSGFSYIAMFTWKNTSSIKKIRLDEKNITLDTTKNCLYAHNRMVRKEQCHQNHESIANHKLSSDQSRVGLGLISCFQPYVEIFPAWRQMWS